MIRSVLFIMLLFFTVIPVQAETFIDADAIEQVQSPEPQNVEGDDVVLEYSQRVLRFKIGVSAGIEKVRSLEVILPPPLWRPPMGKIA